MTALTVNGQPVRYRLAPETPLLWALRDVSNLTGTKYGCGTGACGSCTVLVDGKAARSCVVTLAAVEGTQVTTVEALSRDRRHPVQQAFAAAGAVMCGYCTPGMVMAAAALIATDPDLDDAAVTGALSNLCRCGVQPRLVGAVRRAAAAARGDIRLPALPSPRIDPGDTARAVGAMGPPPVKPAER